MSGPTAPSGDRSVTTVITNIGWLVSHDPAHSTRPASGHGRSTPAGTDLPGAGRGLADAWLVYEGDQGTARVIAVGTGTPPTADRRIDVAGRAVLPGFVDSHTHMVFGGDRAQEFTARMAGQPYQAGGIATTIAATRSADDETLRRDLAIRLRESRAAGITTREIKSGYGATTDSEAHLLRLAGEVTQHTTLLGAHVTPPEFDGDTDAYVSMVINEMIPACADLARGIDVFCEQGAFDADQSRAILQAGIADELTPRIHANQLRAGPGIQLAVELNCASADHCTYLTNADVAALAASSTVATLLPATDFSTRQPYPDARRLIDAGATVALATNCNPGSSYTMSMSFVIALAVRDCHMTLDEAVWAATAGGARSLGEPDIGHLRAGAKADLILLDAPHPDHLAYRPGMPLIAATIENGAVVWQQTPVAERGGYRAAPWPG